MTSDEIHLFTPGRPYEGSGQLRREAFLLSIIVHLLVVLLVVLGPRVLPRNQPAHETEREPAKRLGFLALPKDYQKTVQKRPAPQLSDKDRMAQGPAPKTDPRGLQAPHSKGNTERPEKSGTRGQPTRPDRTPPQPVASPPAPETVSQPLQTTETDRQTESAKRTPAPEATAGSSLLKQKADLKSELKDLYAGLRLPSATIPDSPKQAEITGRSGSGDYGDGHHSRLNFDNRQPKFSVNRPTILSDTQGVNFGPWLTAVYFRVRDNWYSVIPQVYRSGLKGVVVIVFDVRRNGSLDELQVVRSSGLSPYDRAAISSLKLSEPFPDFPPTFDGEQLTLQFTYLYNIPL